MSDRLIGMNADEVDDLGRFLNGRGGEIRSMVQQIDWLIGRTYWVGPAADQFKHAWWPEHKGRLLECADRIEGLSRSARNNADEQRRVSGDAGSGGSTGLAAAHSSGGVAASGARAGDTAIPWAETALTAHSTYELVRHGSGPARAALAGGEGVRSAISAAAGGAHGATSFGWAGVAGAGLGVAATAHSANEHGLTDVRTIKTGVVATGGTVSSVVAGPAGSVVWWGSTAGTEWAVGEVDRRYDIHQQHVDDVIARRGEVPLYEGAGGFGQFMVDWNVNTFDNIRTGLRGWTR